MLQPWNEIIEAQKIRSDLLKWKIIVVAALGATGFGLSGKQTLNSDLVLCCIFLSYVLILIYFVAIFHCE